MINRIRTAVVTFARDWWQWLNNQPRAYLIAPAAVVAVLWLLLWWLS